MAWKWSVGLKASGMGAGSPLDSVVLLHLVGPYEPRLFRKPKEKQELWQHHGRRSTPES